MKNKDNKSMEQKDYKGASKILGVVIAIEILIIFACVGTGIKGYRNYFEMPASLMVKCIEEGEWDRLLSYYSNDYNPDYKYKDDVKAVIATAEYYDHACLHAAAVYADDTQTAEREAKFMAQAYDDMGEYQQYKAQIDKYVSEKGVR